MSKIDAQKIDMIAGLCGRGAIEEALYLARRDLLDLARHGLRFREFFVEGTTVAVPFELYHLLMQRAQWAEKAQDALSNIQHARGTPLDEDYVTSLARETLARFPKEAKHEQER